MNRILFAFLKRQRGKKGTQIRSNSCCCLGAEPEPNQEFLSVLGGLSTRNRLWEGKLERGRRAWITLSCVHVNHAMFTLGQKKFFFFLSEHTSAKEFFLCVRSLSSQNAAQQTCGSRCVHGTPSSWEREDLSFFRAPIPSVDPSGGPWKLQPKIEGALFLSFWLGNRGWKRTLRI